MGKNRQTLYITATYLRKGDENTNMLTILHLPKRKAYEKNRNSIFGATKDKVDPVNNNTPPTLETALLPNFFVRMAVGTAKRIKLSKIGI